MLDDLLMEQVFKLASYNTSELGQRDEDLFKIIDKARKIVNDILNNIKEN